ncbi:MAG: putative capsid protein [Circoviridae sp.]|nr:MAG: putative capsid protein [Circoviridae sp.]
MPPKKLKLKISNVKAIARKEAESVIKVKAEKKYMDSNNALHGLSPTRPTGNDYLSCIAFSTTTNEDPQGTPMVYGGQQVKEMLCLKPFQSNNADQDLQLFTPIGKRLQPVSCKSRWRINRNFARIDPINHSSGAVPDFPVSLAENCPVICRMIRVQPKIEAGTETEVSPADDLFQDTYGRAIGVDNTDFTEAEMLAYRVNKRKYKVLEDKNFIIRPPLTLQYQASPANVSGTFSEAIYTPLVSNTNGNCEKYMTTYDQLSVKKNGSVFYTDPSVASTNTATTGHKRSYYFFHFAYQGADQITGDGADRAKGPIDIVVDLVNVTKFIDI